jgi:hypothetical protein
LLRGKENDLEPRRRVRATSRPKGWGLNKGGICNGEIDEERVGFAMKMETQKKDVE